MPWPIRYHETRPYPARVGDCWPLPDMVEGENAGWHLDHVLSNQYRRDHFGRRPPLVVVLPGLGGGFNWVNLDARASTGKDSGEGWTVTGDPPRLTVTPSVNVVGQYHGFIKDGVITDDVEGRTYPELRDE